MKNTLLLLFLCFCKIAAATDYYVGSIGNDTNNGLSSSTPWKTIDKVNTSFSIIKPGDRILFNRGDTFYGTLTITKSGTSAAPITIGAYGTGVEPVITGFTTITGWTNQGNGVYSKIIACQSSPNMVIINNKQYPMGRWPKSDYNKYESCTSNSITDNGLGNSPNWTGAEVIIRKNDWTLDRSKITNHTGDVLTYSNLGTNETGYAGWGYYIQNDLRCVTQFGDWYYNPAISTFYMYFGSANPNDFTVKVTTLNRLINNAGYDYISIDGISLTGANQACIYFSGYYTDNAIIKNCTINYSGGDGIYMEGCRNFLADYNYINRSSRTGIYVLLGSNNKITNNTIKNSGLIGGIANSATYNNGIWFTQTQLAGETKYALIQYNNIDSCGYNGIYFGGDNIEIRNNFITNIALLLDDAGAIYTASESFVGRIIEGNIILNIFGNSNGSTNTTPLSEGIYLDDNATNITVRNNTIAYSKNSGIKVHRGNSHNIKANTCFDDFRGIFFYGSGATEEFIYGMSILDNIFIATTSLQYALYFVSVTNNIPSFGTADNNYYARPSDDINVFCTNQPSTGAKVTNLSGWQKLTNQDLNSHKSPITVTNVNDFRFEYNATKTNKVITLDKPMIDVKGTKYQISITLLPYTSAVLMVDPNPAQPVVPVYKGSAIENATPSLLEMVYSVNLANTVPAASAFNVQVNGLNRSVTAISISGDKVRLTLASNVVFGDIVTVTYTKPASNPLQTPSGGHAINITAQSVVNNCLDLTIPNDPPTIVIKNKTSSYSGFVDEIDASGTYDLNNDILTYEWTVPKNVPVNSTNGTKIQFLSPVVNTAQVFEFQLRVNDGKVIVTRTIPIEIMPYKPELAAARILTIEASGSDSVNYPANAADGKLTTKWSVNGDNQWLLFKLGVPFKISHIFLAFLPWQKYESYFDIYTSSDNLIWDPILTKAASCKFSGDMQVFDFPASKTNTDYTYIKLVGHGNSLNTLNNISEFQIIGSLSQNPRFVDNTKKRNVVIYPNPAQDFFNISIEEPTIVPDMISIIDLSGNIVFEVSLESGIKGIKNVQIPNNFNTGVYIVELRSGSLILDAQKLIINRSLVN